MNGNQIINMIIRLVMRKLINGGINAGMKRMSGGRGQRPAPRQHAQAAHVPPPEPQAPPAQGLSARDANKQRKREAKLAARAAESGAESKGG